MQISLSLSLTLSLTLILKRLTLWYPFPAMDCVPLVWDPNCTLADLWHTYSKCNACYTHHEVTYAGKPLDTQYAALWLFPLQPWTVEMKLIRTYSAEQEQEQWNLYILSRTRARTVVAMVMHAPARNDLTLLSGDEAKVVKKEVHPEFGHRGDPPQPHLKITKLCFDAHYKTMHSHVCLLLCVLVGLMSEWAVPLQDQSSLNRPSFRLDQLGLPQLTWPGLQYLET